mmetsp:Transcript_19017/g.26777  ORF Transcript_19017/g.26777 Transcript_19017/m.26777 type:complete len:360 (+) Transcript_19017:112-1191(+)
MYFLSILSYSRNLKVFFSFFISVVLFQNIAILKLESCLNQSLSHLDGTSNPIDDIFERSNHAKPQILRSDLIYSPISKPSHPGPFVIEEYKLIFFSVPKVGCSEWKLLLMRMSNNPLWCCDDCEEGYMHEMKLNKLKILRDYTTEEATNMMTSPDWTRAIFLRDPKERILSAFLDKARNEYMFRSKCCDAFTDSITRNECYKCLSAKESTKPECQTPETYEKFLHFVTKYPDQCTNKHWEQMSSKVDSKWWPYMNFIGSYDNMHIDAMRLLQGLHSDSDPIEGRSAWERYGQNGWGTSNGCENRPSKFLEINTSYHNLGANSQMTKWYNPQAHSLVEKYWASDYDIKGSYFERPKGILV